MSKKDRNAKEATTHPGTVTRRAFLKYSGAGLLTLYAYPKLGGVAEAMGTIPGGSLAPASVPKYRTPLLVPPVMPSAGVVRTDAGRKAELYEISMKQFAQQILPAGMPRTTVWGYGAVASGSRRGLLIHHAPSLTIEAKWNVPVVVKWINNLKDAKGNYLPHLLPVDPTLHWANPRGGRAGRDKRPRFSRTPDRYTGPVPIVTHLHGALSGDESDGYAEAWYLPNAVNIPAGYALRGTWYDFFASKAKEKFGAHWSPGSATFYYPNNQRATTLWYHDHALGITRLNVYTGPAGFYIIRGGPAGDSEVLDSRSGHAAVLPGPAPREGDPFPSHKDYYDIPLAIQDRSFNIDGSLFYPDTRKFFDGIGGPYIPRTDVSPIWNPEFFGNAIIVNGNTWPFLNVEKRRYRFRFLNGCNSRVLILDFRNIPGVRVWMIGNDGGFLTAPVNLTAVNHNRLPLAPAERADVIVDFTDVPPGRHVLANVGSDEPFGGGVPGVDFPASDPATTGQIMQFRVGKCLSPDRSTPPRFLVLPQVNSLKGGATRRLALLEKMSSSFADAPTEARLGTVIGDPDTGARKWTSLQWHDNVTENPAEGATETWEFYNATEDAHPIHVHAVHFQPVDRQEIVVDDMKGTVRLTPDSTVQPPHPWEKGYKDTIIAYPGQVTRVRARFVTPGQFVWHCHILEHEDNNMMRPYRIGPPQAGQPMPMSTPIAETDGDGSPAEGP